MGKRRAVKERARSADEPHAASTEPQRPYIHDLPDELLLVVSHVVHALAAVRNVVHMAELLSCLCLPVSSATEWHREELTTLPMIVICFAACDPVSSWCFTKRMDGTRHALRRAAAVPEQHWACHA